MTDTQLVTVGEGEDDIVISTQLTRPTPPGSKLTPELVLRICKYLQDGVSVNRATKAAGITPKTYQTWRNRGEEDPDSAYAEATHIFEMVQSRSIAEDIAYIRSGGPQWQSRAWRLERQFQNEFALINRTELTGADGGAVQVNAAMLIAAIKKQDNDQVNG